MVSGKSVMIKKSTMYNAFRVAINQVSLRDRIAKETDSLALADSAVCQ